MQRSKLPYFALALTCLVWGTTWVASKIGIQGVHPLYFSGLRQTLGGLCYLVFFMAIGKAVWPTPKQWGYLVMMAILLFVSSNGLTTWGIKYISSGLGAILGAVFPLFVAIIDMFIGGKDKPNLVSNIGVVLGFAGVAVIFYEHLGDFANAEFAFGIGISLVASVTWAAGTVLTSRMKLGLNRYYGLGWQMLLAGVILNLISGGAGLSIPLTEIPAKTWWCLAYMVLFGSVITFGAFLYSLQHLPATLASIYAYINPVVAVILGHFLLGEDWSIFLLAGALVTLAGVYLVNAGFRISLKRKEELDEEVIGEGRRF